MKQFSRIFIAFLIVAILIFWAAFYQPFGIRDYHFFPIVFGSSVLAAFFVAYRSKLPALAIVVIFLLAFLLITLMVEEPALPLTELIVYSALAIIGILLTVSTAKKMNGFQQEYNAVGMLIERNSVLGLDQVRPLVESEFARGMRYEYPISVIAFEADGSGDESLQQAAEILTDLFKQQISANQLSSFLQAKSRITDILMHRDQSNQFLLLCPGINADQAKQFTNRLENERQTNEHLQFSHRVISFPEDARSFDAILEMLDTQP